MNIYLINALLILLVVRQIREHQLDLRALAVPVLAVAAAAVMFLHSVPGGGSDIALDLVCVSAGAAMGAIGGLATRLRLGADGRPLGRAGVLAASMWIAGVGARMVFYFAATHGAGPAIAAFSIAHHITGSAAWTAALVMMALADVLTRLVVVHLRGRQAHRQGHPGHRGICPGRRRCLSWHPSPRSPDRAREGAADRGALFMPPARPAPSPPANVRCHTREHRQLAAAGAASARPGMPRHRRDGPWLV